MGGSAIARRPRARRLPRAHARARSPWCATTTSRAGSASARSSILSSYSGGTEETLTAASQALERNASAWPSPAAASSARSTRPRACRSSRSRPASSRAPRCCACWCRCVVVLDRMRVLPTSSTSDLEEARGTRRERAISRPSGPTCPRRATRPSSSPARCTRPVPLVWGAELTAPVAVRWKGQFNENAKMPAYASALPELDHNEICGFDGHARRAEPPRQAGDAARPAPAPPGGAALRPHPRARRAARRARCSRSPPRGRARWRGCSTW